MAASKFAVTILSPFENFDKTQGEIRIVAKRVTNSSGTLDVTNFVLYVECTKENIAAFDMLLQARA